VTLYTAHSYGQYKLGSSKEELGVKQ